MKFAGVLAFGLLALGATILTVYLSNPFAGFVFFYLPAIVGLWGLFLIFLIMALRPR